MEAVRREAAARPLARIPPGLAGPIPAWACTAAAILAIFAAGFVVGRSVTVADQHIRAPGPRASRPKNSPKVSWRRARERRRLSL
jgi:hypothetical protein